MIDLDALRRQLPALADGRARFDGPGGSLVPRAVAHAVASTLASGICQRGPGEVGSRAERVVVEARSAVADLLGGDPRGVVFGRSMTQLTFDLARTLAHDPARPWRAGDEVVVTRLDHDAHVRPWVTAAERAGATVRWADPDPATGDLPDEVVTALVGPRTRLVAITGASNLIGTRPDVAAVAAAAHAHGALVSVDAVALAPHAPVDRAALGADVVLCSPYKFLGPHLGAMVADPAWLETLHPDKLAPSTDAVPERFELGTLPYELLAGTTAAVEVLAGLAPGGGDGGAEAPRRARLRASMTAVEEHEHALLAQLLAGLDDLPHVRVQPAPPRRTPTVLLHVDGLAPAEVTERLAAAGVDAPAGTFYAHELGQLLGLHPAGGVRVGLECYTTPDEVDRLVAALATLA